MAINLFENILNAANPFMAKQPTQPVQNAPVAPRTASYVQPKKTAPVQPTPTPVDSELYKFLQWGADLYSGIQNRLWETFQQEKQIAQQSIQEKQKQFVSDMLAKWYGKEDIFAALDQLKAKWEFDYKPWFSARVVGGIESRMGEVAKTTETLSNVQNPLQRIWVGTLAYGGDVVATAMEPIAAAISPVVQKAIEVTGQTENVQKFSQDWEEFKVKNPLMAESIEGVFNVGQLAPVPLAKPLANVAKQWGKVIVKQAEKVVPDLWKTAMKLKSKADLWFRQQAEEIALPKLSDMWIRDRNKVAWDVIETKPWLFTKEELVRSPQESLAIEEVSRLIKEWKVKKWASEIKNSAAIEWEIANLSKTLDADMKDIVHKPMTKVEVEALFDDIAKNLDENPVLGELKTTTDRVIAQLRKNLNKDTYSASDLIQLRKQFDADIRKFKWDLPFSPERETAFSTILRDFRQWLNNKAAELVPDAKVRQLLDRQSALYIARDTIESRWARQANTTIWRILSKIQKTTGIPRTEIIELSTALWLLWAWTLAPIVNPVATAITAWALVKAWAKRILSPQNKLRLSNLLNKIDSALKKNPNDSELIKVKQLFTNPPKDGWNISDIFGDSDTWWVPKPIIKPSPKPQTNIVVPKKTIEKKTIVKPSPKVKPVEKTVKASDKIDAETKKVYKRLLYPEWKWDTMIPVKYNWKVVWGIDAHIDRFRPERMNINYIGILPEFQGKWLWTEAIKQLFKDNPNIDELLWHSTAEAMSFWKKQTTEFTGTDKNIFKIKRSDYLKSKPLSPQKTVKPLTPKKESATIGDMETKKLITSSDKEMELAMNMIKDWQASDKWAESRFWKDIWESYKNSQKKPEIKKIEKPSEQNWSKTAYEESLVQKAKEKAEMYLMDWYEDTLSQMQRWTARRLLKEKMVRTENWIITKQEFLKEKVNQGYKLNTAGTILSKDWWNVGIKINNSYEKWYIEYLKNTRK